VLVVLKLDILPSDVLFDILLLLHLEHLLVKNLLQFFVCVVDTELFKGIILEYFKAKYVKQADKHQIFIFVLLLHHGLRLRTNRYVHLLDNPVEQTPIEMLSQCVSSL
jgi:hypothetical protein